MSEEQNEQLFDLLTRKAVYGLDVAEQAELDTFDSGVADAEFRSLEMVAAAVSLVGYNEGEPLPAHLFNRIAADAESYFAPAQSLAEEPWPPVNDKIFTANDIFTNKPSRSWFGWLGWAVAAVACIALAINVGMTRFGAEETAKVIQPVNTPQPLAPEQLREQFMQNTPNAMKANWAVASPKDTTQISGDIVWSVEKQSGYMRFRGLPVNDAAKSTYQLWIFDKTQDKATPIDGGTFDVSTNGEVVIPINAKLRAMGPEMFAITVEKPGGVVVSKSKKIAAIAKIETQNL